MSFFDSLTKWTTEAFAVRRSRRDKNLKHGNLNVSDLAKEAFESTSSEEDPNDQISKKDATTTTDLENSTQTDPTYIQESWRKNSEINSDIDKSSENIEADDEDEDDEIEVEKTDREIELEQTLGSLSLRARERYSEEIKRQRKHIFGENHITNSVSEIDLTVRRKVTIRKRIQSCPVIRVPFEEGQTLEIEEESELLVEPSDLLQSLQRTEIDYKDNFESIEPQNSNYEEFSPIGPNSFTYENAIDNLISIEKNKIHQHKERISFEDNYNPTKYLRLGAITKKGYENYKNWRKLDQEILQIKRHTEQINAYHFKNLETTKGNNKILDNILHKYQFRPGVSANFRLQNSNTTTINMVALSPNTNKILKRIPNISSEDSKSEIRENVEKLRTFARQIPENEIPGFIEALATNFDCAIREALEVERLNTIDEMCDLIVKKFVLKGNYDKKLDEFKKLKKKKSESYTDFGTRIIKFKNDLIKMAKYKDDDDKFEGRKTNIEDEALKLYLKSLRKHLTLVFRYGDPKTITEARNWVEKAEERMAFSDEESSDDEKEKSKNKDVNWTRKFFRNSVKKCQICDASDQENQHEALTCTKTACAYCGTSFHVTKLCNIISENRKIKMICKLCSAQTHTIDLCPNKNDNTRYCQYCQDSNCCASRCEKIKSAKTCSICGQQEHEYGRNCPMNHMIAKYGQDNQQRPLGPCYNCQGPHLAAQCPEKQSSGQNMQVQQYRGQQRQNFRGGPSYGRGYQNNGPRMFYRGGGNQNNQASQRGGYNTGQYQQNRGGWNYRGQNNFRGSYNQNYRGNGNGGYQNYRTPRNTDETDLNRMRSMFEQWLTHEYGRNNGQAEQQQRGAVPKITFPPNNPKN